MKYIDKIIKFLEKIGGENVHNNNINGQEIIGFSFILPWFIDLACLTNSLPT